MKKEIALILTATCLAGALSSCRGEEDNALSDTNDTHPVTTQTTGTSESTAGLKVPTDTQPPAAPSVVTDAQGLTYINGILVVNKTYALPSTYDPGVDSEAYAALQGRDFVIPEDIKAMAPHVLAHRLSSASLSRAEEAGAYLQRLIDSVPVPTEQI